MTEPQGKLPPLGASLFSTSSYQTKRHQQNTQEKLFQIYTEAIKSSETDRRGKPGTTEDWARFPHRPERSEARTSPRELRSRARLPELRRDSNREDDSRGSQEVAIKREEEEEEEE